MGYTPAVPQTAAPGTDGRLRHVVMFRFRSDAPPGSVQKVEEGFKKLVCVCVRARAQAARACD